MSVTRSTRERQLPRTKRSSPSSVSSFFSVNKSSSAPLRSSKPAGMQDPTPRPRVRRPKRYAARKQPSDRFDVMAPALKAEEVPVAPIERPNVFTFMEEEQPEETVVEQDVADSKPEGQTTEPRPEAPPYSNASCARSESDDSEDSQRTRVEEYINQAISFHSDSGISVGASSSEHDSPVQCYHVLHKGSPALGTGTVDAAQPTTVRTARLDKQKSEVSGREFDAEPEAYYSSARQLPFDMAYQHPAAPNHPSPPQSLYPDTRRPQTQQEYTKRGYDLLASNISSNGAAALKPLYRKFEAFNNRILLYLQDEIAEMEEELRQLDDAIAREGECMGGKIASRRAEARLPSHLQWCRLELLGRSFAKIEQYSKFESPTAPDDMGVNAPRHRSSPVGLQQPHQDCRACLTSRCRHLSRVGRRAYSYC